MDAELDRDVEGSSPRRVRPRARGRQLLVAHPLCLARAGDSESGPARERPGAFGQARGPAREEIQQRPGPGSTSTSTSSSAGGDVGRRRPPAQK